jgi:hypothetical protein
MGPMHRRPLSVPLRVVAGLAVLVVAAALVVTRLVTAPDGSPDRRAAPRVRTAPMCPAAPGVPLLTPVHLVADLDQVHLPDDAARPALLAAAQQYVDGAIPVVRPIAGDGTDPMRYLYDDGVALRRVTGMLGYAYAATRDRTYLDALAAQTVRAARWPDWNQSPEHGHPLDTAQVATAVALGFAWSRTRMTAEEQREVATALVDRFLRYYVCGTGPGIAARRTGGGNQATVVGTAAVLAGLAVRPDQPAWGSAAVLAGAAGLSRHAAADGSGHSLADGPTVEGLMYTNYEAANIALLQATVGADPHDPVVAGPLRDSLPSLDALAAWNERCGRVADPAVQDGWGVYPWVDRTTALAAMAASANAGPRVTALIATLQTQARLTIPGEGAWAVPDGIAELVLGQESPGTSGPPQPQAYVAGGPATGRYYGCATAGDTYAFLSAVPNDAPHAHQDIGNVVVKEGEQTVLDDLGQRTYSFTGGPVWRASTKAHSTIGVGQPDGSVLQRRSGSGAVTVEGTDLLMSTGTALPGVDDWQRRVSTSAGRVQVVDTLSAPAGSTVPLSMSWLVGAAPSDVAQQADGSLRVTMPDGSVWQLVPPQGTSVTVSDAAPTPPYVDAPDIGPIAAAHTLVVVRSALVGTASLTTTLTKVG